MPTRDVRVSLPSDMLFDTASKVLGLAGVSANALINAALRLYNGEEKDQVIRDLQPQTDLRGSEKRAKVDAGLLENVENGAYAARVGIGIALGMDREQAEEWAKITEKRGGARPGAGRPRKAQQMT
jgi:hypothetical protein